LEVEMVELTGQPPRLLPPEVVAVKKSVRTWGCFVPLGAVGLIVVGIVIAWIVEFAEIGNQLGHSFEHHGFKNPFGCTSNPPPYPDRQPTDCVAAATNPIGIGDALVTATWTRSTDNSGTAFICAAVNILNFSDLTLSYNDHYWSLQTPGGTVANANSVATGGLGSGELVMGGMASGNVCFDDSEQTGTYVGIYKDPLNLARGIWLVPLT
jgi:hypothetical protein